MNRDTAIAIAELAVTLSHVGGDRRPFVHADVAARLTALERRAQRHAERLCNEPVSEETDAKTRASIAKAAAAQLARIGLTVAVEIGGDPRGCCLRLKHPSMPSHGFGAEPGEYKVGC